MPEDLAVQFPYARQVCEVLGVAALELAGYEADDVIATFAREAREAGRERLAWAARAAEDAGYAMIVASSRGRML